MAAIQAVLATILAATCRSGSGRLQIAPNRGQVAFRSPPPRRPRADLWPRRYALLVARSPAASEPSQSPLCRARCPARRRLNCSRGARSPKAGAGGATKRERGGVTARHGGGDLENPPHLQTLPSFRFQMRPWNPKTEEDVGFFGSPAASRSASS